MNSLAPSYDFFTYFFTLVLTPMLLLSGVFFPVDQMPPVLQLVASFLPLKHAIDLARPLLMGAVPSHILLHIAVLLAYALRGVLRRARADAAPAAAVTERFFAPCPRGLEAPLAKELDTQGAQFVAPAEGGVAFSGPQDLAYRVNLESRIASRVLWQVAHGRYRNEQELYALVRAIDWGSTSTPSARCASTSPRRARRSPSLEFATLKVKDAVCDRFRDDAGKRPSVDKQRPDVRVHAYLTDREATIYLDTSGEPLVQARLAARHRRRAAAREPRRGPHRACRDGRRARRSSTRCAAAARSRSRPRRWPPTARRA